MKYLAVLITSSALMADFDLPGRSDIAEFRRPTPVETQVLAVSFRRAPPVVTTQLLAAQDPAPVQPDRLPTPTVIALPDPAPSTAARPASTSGPAILRPRARPVTALHATLRPRLRPAGLGETLLAAAE